MGQALYKNMESIYEKTQRLIDEISDKRIAFLEAEIKGTSPRNSFIASDIPECDRYLVHSILDWKQRGLHDAGLQALFDAGNAGERAVLIHLQELGFTVMQQQSPFDVNSRDGKLICRGRIDGKILYEKQAIPFEIKTMNQNTFNGIHDIEDFQKKPHLRKYLRQMQLYLFGNSIEAGMFILYDLQGHYKLLPVALDYGECEFILKRLERAYDFLQRKEYPARIEYDNSACGKCAFAHVCLPDVNNKPPNMINNPELEAALERRGEIQPIAKEFESLDADLKDKFKNLPHVLVGDKFQIVGKEREVSRVNTKALPDDIREKYTEKTKSWITKIIRLSEAKP
jgi:CRISPR/Cas system-associated exonuclease Cas4 (RecB family)